MRMEYFSLSTQCDETNVRSPEDRMVRMWKEKLMLHISDITHPRGDVNDVIESLDTLMDDESVQFLVDMSNSNQDTMKHVKMVLKIKRADIIEFIEVNLEGATRYNYEYYSAHLKKDLLAL